MSASLISVIERLEAGRCSLPAGRREDQSQAPASTICIKLFPTDWPDSPQRALVEDGYHGYQGLGILDPD